MRASFCRPGARGRAPRSSGDLLHDIEYKHNYHKMVLPLPILFLSFSLSQSPRADPEHEAIPRMGYPEWDALCALFDHSFPTITTTSTIVNFISKISSLRYIKEHPVRRSPSSCSIHLEPRKPSCWFSNLRCWYTKKTD